MKLYENEAKDILKKQGLKTPSDKENGFVVKAQVLANHRKEKDGIKFADTREEAEELAEEMKGIEIDGQKVEDVLIEPQANFSEEYYVSFMYDTDTRSPIMIFSREGGTGIEDKETSKLVLEDDSQFRFRNFLNEEGFEGKEILKLGMTLQNLFHAFLEEDARLLEINPLAKTEEEYVVLDAMMDLEDDASYRHDWDYPERNAEGGEKTERERKAEKIDEDDHRGVAGKYTELDGDIGMMLAGGGASLTNMDALIEYGGKPANYTEYGGNPPTEKVYKLSKVIMSKDIKGLWHVGGTANNTDVERTIDGFIQALREEKPDYPIVVRRDGPHADEAFEKLRKVKEELDLSMKLFRNDKPMTESAEDLMEMVKVQRGESQTMNKIPVFDIGDTLAPSNSKIQEVIADVIGDAPEINVNDYNPYVPEEMQEWLDENDLEGDGEDITEAYLDWKREHLSENVFPMIDRIADDFGPIGLISDNSIAAKEFYSKQFREAGIDLEGFVVSEEVGVKKPGREIFEAFLEQREEDSERFVYFGNYVDRDKGAEKVGMHFVWVKEYCVYGSSTDGLQIEKLSYENIEWALKQVENS